MKRKILLSFLIAAVLALGATLPAFADDTGPVSKINEKSFVKSHGLHLEKVTVAITVSNADQLSQLQTYQPIGESYVNATPGHYDYAEATYIDHEIKTPGKIFAEYSDHRTRSWKEVALNNIRPPNKKAMVNSESKELQTE